MLAVVIVLKIMNAKIKADELVSKFNGVVNGYVGSSMLTNTEYPETILANAKICALKVVDEVRCELKEFDDDFGYTRSRLDFWEEVIKEIQLITVS